MSIHFPEFRENSMYSFRRDRTQSGGGGSQLQIQRVSLGSKSGTSMRDRISHQNLPSLQGTRRNFSCSTQRGIECFIRPPDKNFKGQYCP